MSRRIGGVLFAKVDGSQLQAKGSWEYLINPTKKEMVAGSDSIHGYKEMPQVPYIQGAITDSADLDLEALQALNDSTITLELANGKVIVLRNAIYAADGVGSTEEGEVEVRFEGLSGEEIR